MSIEKSELKAAFAHSFGCDADDDLEAALRDELRAVGRNQAAQVMANEITKIISKLKDDMESDTPPFRSTEEHQTAQAYLRMCLAQAVTLGKNSDNLRLQMEGKAMAFRHTITRLTKIKEAEEAKAAAVLAAAAASPGEDGPRVPGTHPGQSIAQKRKAESMIPHLPKSREKAQTSSAGKSPITEKKVKKKKKKKAKKG